MKANKEVLEKYREEAGIHGPILFGTYEEAKKWVGRKTEMYQLEDPVDRFRIKLFAEWVEDENPSYWDEEFAKKEWGGIIAPPGMLVTFAMPFMPLWRPKHVKVVERPMLVMRIPLPGNTMINVETDTTFYKPIRVGDRLSYQEEVLSVSEEKKTSLGPGHFIVTVARYYNQNGELVAEEKNTLFRFSVGGD